MKCRVRLQYIAMHATTLKNWDIQGAGYAKSGKHAARRRANLTIVGGESNCREVSCAGTTVFQLRCEETFLGRLVIRPQGICALEAALQIGHRKRLIGSFVRQFEFLTSSQSHDSRQRQLLFGKIIPGSNKLLSAGLK